MKVLSIGSDRSIFESGSKSSKRMGEYSRIVDELHIIIFSKRKLGLKKAKIGTDVYIYPTNSRTKIGYVFDAIKIGRNILKDNKFDLVTTQDPFEAGLVGRSLSKRFGLKLQIQVHTDLFDKYFKNDSILNYIRIKIAKKIIPTADGIRVVSERIKKSIQENLKLNSKIEINVLPIFVDIEKIKNSPITIDLHKKYPQFKTIVLMVSRLEKEKNIKSALNILQNILKKYPKTGLIIAGDGVERKSLENYTRNLSIEKNVVFKGYIEDIISLYKTSDILFHTSNYEGYGMIFIEAVSSNCPIVSTNVGIINDYFEDSKSVFICNVGDNMCLEEKLTKLIKDKNLRKTFIENAQYMLNKNIKEKTTEEYLLSYKKLFEKSVA